VTCGGGGGAREPGEGGVDVNDDDIADSEAGGRASSRASVDLPRRFAEEGSKDSLSDEDLLLGRTLLDGLIEGGEVMM
jgi:hypothetical protein